jgi:hypothetical protein
MANTKERAIGAINDMIDAVKPMTETLAKTYLPSEEDLADWHVGGQDPMQIVVTALAEADRDDDLELTW